MLEKAFKRTFQDYQIAQNRGNIATDPNNPYASFVPSSSKMPKSKLAKAQADEYWKNLASQLTPEQLQEGLRQLNETMATGKSNQFGVTSKQAGALKTSLAQVMANKNANQTAIDQQILANNPNIDNVFGTQTLVKDPVTGQYTVKSTLSQPEQARYDMGNQSLAGANQIYQDIGNNGGNAYSQIDSLLNKEMTGSAYNKDVADAMYNQWQVYNDPAQQSQLQQIMDRMQARGINGSTPLYQSQMKNILDAQNRARQNAQFESIIQGNNIGMQQRGQNLDTIRTRADLITQGINNRINGANGLVGIDNAVRPSIGNFNSNYTGADILGLYQNDKQLNQENNQFKQNMAFQQQEAAKQRRQGMTNSVFGVTGATIGLMTGNPAPAMSGLKSMLNPSTGGANTGNFTSNWLSSPTQNDYSLQSSDNYGNNGIKSNASFRKFNEFKFPGIKY